MNPLYTSALITLSLALIFVVHHKATRGTFAMDRADRIVIAFLSIAWPLGAFVLMSVLFMPKNHYE